jgi:hypothetical protein
MRMSHPNTMTTEQIEEIRVSYVGKNQRATAKRVDVAGGVAFLYEDGTSLYGVGFKGKSIKPAFNYRFRSVERRDEYVAQWTRDLEASAQARKERAEKRSSDTHNLMIGSILCSSWGYEQTNIDWYEVIAVVSDKTVVIRKIGARIDNDSGCGPMSGYSTPVPGDYVGEPMRKRANSHGVSLTSYSSAHPWDGKPKHCSWYA